MPEVDVAHGLGRLPFEEDERDYPLSPLLAALPSIPPITRMWSNSQPVLNQGTTQHCCGFGLSQWGNTLPVNSKLGNDDAHDIYYESLAAGGQPRGELGSTVRWGLKAMDKRGHVASYYRARSYDEALAWVRNPNGGSVILGISWYKGFNTPNLLGTVRPTGNVVGGHCLLWYGASEAYAYWLNSWGSKWGDHGTCRVKHSYAREIINHGGEAWVAVETPLR